MTTAQLIIVCGTALLLALLGVVAYVARHGVPANGAPEYAPGATVVVHTRDGRSVRGTVRDSSSEFLALRGAALLAGDGQQHAMGGLVGFPRDNVGMVQLLDQGEVV